jgi:hypothetical protein
MCQRSEVNELGLGLGSASQRSAKEDVERLYEAQRSFSFEVKIDKVVTCPS